MSQRLLWIVTSFAAAFIVNAQEPADGCRLGAVSEVANGTRQPLVVYDEQGEILNANAPTPNASQLESARVVACGKSKEGHPLYKVQLADLQQIWVRTRFVSFKPTQRALCELSLRPSGTEIAPRNAGCTEKKAQP